MDMNPFVRIIDDIFNQCMYNTFVRKSFLQLEQKSFTRKKYLSLYDYSHLRSCEYNQTSTYMFDQYAQDAIAHLQFFRDSFEEKGKPIKEDCSNVDCKKFDKFSESLGYETSPAIIGKYFSYTSTSPSYNTNRKDFIGFVRVIEDVFQQSMNDSVSRSLIAKTETESIKSVLKLSFEDMKDLIFCVYDKPLPILDGNPDWMSIRLLDIF